jgi:hypothetical protein
MGGTGVGLDSGGGSRGASFGGLGMRAIFSPFGLVHHKPDAQPRPTGGFGWCNSRSVTPSAAASSLLRSIGALPRCG